jgi:hypothetical protein
LNGRRDMNTPQRAQQGKSFRLPKMKHRAGVADDPPQRRESRTPRAQRMSSR